MHLWHSFLDLVSIYSSHICCILTSSLILQTSSFLRKHLHQSMYRPCLYCKLLLFYRFFFESFSPYLRSALFCSQLYFDDPPLIPKIPQMLSISYSKQLFSITFKFYSANFQFAFSSLVIFRTHFSTEVSYLSICYHFILVEVFHIYNFFNEIQQPKKHIP